MKPGPKHYLIYHPENPEKSQVFLSKEEAESIYLDLLEHTTVYLFEQVMKTTVYKGAV